MLQKQFIEPMLQEKQLKKQFSDYVVDPGIDEFILLESGDNILLETGDSVLKE